MSAHAQDSATVLKPVTVIGKGDPAISVSGWGALPLSKSPFQASAISDEQMHDLGVQRLADVVRIDPAVDDAYNTEGYWDYLTVRGFVIDNRSNYRRDGLPINAETHIPLDNKERIEILKGTSGLQAGVSAPGGLVNFVVKRPIESDMRRARIEWMQSGSLLGAVDLSRRFGVDRAFGLRVNAAVEHIDPRVHDAKGERKLFALAGDWRIAPDMLLEAEIETSHQSQPSVPGFSMLGASVPAPVDPRINLNNQPWSLPVVFDATDASVRFTQRLGNRWRWTAHAATQHLKSDDRIAFPFGCSAEGSFERYCSDGTFDFYDFRSDNERRRTDDLELAVHGEFDTGIFIHDLSAGVLGSRFRARFQGQAFNPVGIGNIDGTLLVPPDPTLGPGSSDRDEDSTELFMRDSARLGDVATAWLGLRHTRLTRRGPDADYQQSFTTPWLALSKEWAPDHLVYASWGEGVQSDVAPNLPTYGAAAGQPLQASKSRQWEIGAKGRTSHATWNIAWFDVVQPAIQDTGAAYFKDGRNSHQGLEVDATWEQSPWVLQGGLQALRARREDSMDPSLNGLRPTNVPATTLKAQVRRSMAFLPGLTLRALLLGESDRMVLPDNSSRIPGYGRVDLAADYTRPTSFGTITWRAGVDNLFDRRAWREAPFEFGHVYLFPLPPRTARLSVEVSL